VGQSAGACVAQVKVERLGDVLGCRFEGEDEVALFLQGSGDVLLASLAQWRSLMKPVVASISGLTGTPPIGSNLTVEPIAPESLNELKSTLLSLGAALS
jgi:hypothetical protein